MKTDNELIAEFMGAVSVASSCDPNGDVTDNTLVYRFNGHEYKCHFNSFGSAYGDVYRFAASWDWLMPVVQKVRDLSIAVEISYSLGTVCKICYKTGSNFQWICIEENDGISAVYKAVIEYIKWYNSKNL